VHREVVEGLPCTRAGIASRRTHSVAELLDILHEGGCPPPPFSERLDELDPYAVEARYGLIEPTALDRRAASRMVEAVVDWAKGQLAGSPGR
jgi:hypothetical protein